MAPKKLDSKTKAQILEKKREAEKLRYLKIKNDPELWELQKKKEQEKYRRKLERGKIKPVSALSSREHRIQKRRWRVNSRKYYENKKTTEKLFTPSNTPSISENNTSSSIPLSSSRQTHLQVLATKRRTKNREARRREVSRLERRVKDLTRKVKSLQKKEQRRLQFVSSPRTKVKRIMKSGDTNLISQKLLFDEIVCRDMKSEYHRPGSRNLIRGMLVNSKAMLKRYRIIKQYNFLSSKLFSKCSLSKSVDGYKMRKFSSIIQIDIQNFFESDDVSQMCPGKNN